MVEIAVMGYGTVGSGVVEILTKHADGIARRAKEQIHIKYILDLRDFPGSPFEEKFTKSFDTILNDPEVRIVVEVMGGLHPAFDYVKRCLENGKSVVTSNKELVAAKGAVLLKIAQKNNLNFLFEASVGGGIPIIRPISQCLAANEVVEIAGILNGTTNFILTKMIREKKGFEETLALAQKLGYAERDPSADIEGCDACRKICILASLAYGKHVYPEQVHTEGITKITLTDVEYAAAWGGVIKLIGMVKRMPSRKVQIIVCPMFLPRESQLANVDDVFNGIMVRGDSTGDIVFYGKGAGKLPTASAVVADVIDCVKHFKARKIPLLGRRFSRLCRRLPRQRSCHVCAPESGSRGCCPDYRTVRKRGSADPQESGTGRTGLCDPCDEGKGHRRKARSAVRIRRKNNEYDPHRRSVILGMLR